MDFIRKEKEKLEQSATLLRRRRINWRVCTRRVILKEFKRAEEIASSEKFPFSLYSQSFTQNINYETIQISFGFNPIGVIQVEKTRTENGVSQNISNIIERDCALVVSQNASGSIAFILYPYKSEKIERKEENIILYYGLDPNDVTPKLIRKALRYFFLYARTSSVYGMGAKPTIIESLPIFYLTMRDIRNRNRINDKAAMFFVEWGKAIIAACAAYLFAKYTGK